ncbi:MAG: hypothetical protein HN736_03805 [Anaerolineae bacterium]|jgi:CYTH domain-containing protein|nr:hypothetical protein [Anaerolineae bacterium]MBT3713756.1 hypothetical protein [Anaerolineae bacterium]MBT4309868.1 hypothetical protein [Anaerolineae bacterium]MBT4457517.1 hypothetical protein [Anaerolineae bacterium]MBT4843618.1 hypothetical protein [Anaerolineae bacterium]
MNPQRIGKYACLETERRFLLNELPEHLLENSTGWLITDRYIPNTRIRLRHMQSLSDDRNIYKLTQKYRAEHQDASETTITNIYLTKIEYDLFSTLGAKLLRKRRYPYKIKDHTFSIDIFEGRYQGLILAEIEFEKIAEKDKFLLPSFAVKDITDDVFFTGGNLVNLTAEEFKEELSKQK